MPTHRELIDQLYRRMNAQDLTLTELCSPDVEWHWPPNTPGAEIFRGREQMALGLTTWTESWGEIRFDVEEIVENGDWVLGPKASRTESA